MRLTKHHGLGNDFLVLLDPDDTTPIDADVARALCDRRRGVGADGLIRVSPGTSGAEVTMTLLNSDGSPAEMSGNGIRCLGQAVARDRGMAELDLHVATAGGPRHLSIAPGPEDATALVRVDMGAARPVELVERESWGWTSTTPLPRSGAGEPTYRFVEPVKRMTLDLGNPHLVLLVDDPWSVPIEVEGPLREPAFEAGINIEWIAPTPGEDDALTLRVWERGAGVTEACGTGACAAASAANQWGLVGERVTVHMPGGDVEVVLGGDGRPDAVTLIGPATFVAAVEVPWR
jgi:diaminopimelate epimerase